MESVAMATRPLRTFPVSVFGSTSTGKKSNSASQSFFRGNWKNCTGTPNKEIVCLGSAGPSEVYPESKHQGYTSQSAGGKRIAGVDQSHLVDSWLLADPNSRFAEFHGVQIHYKIAHPLHEVSKDQQHRPSNSMFLPAILLHGFGASLFSWERVMAPLAELLHSKVVAFDRPAFGLTSRVRIPLVKASRSNEDAAPIHLNPYTVSFSSSATIAFLDFLQSIKALLIGHSAGCIVAVDAYFKAPERVAAIIMVAPALMAPLLPPKREMIHNQNGEYHPLVKALLSICCAVVNKVAKIFQMISNLRRRLWSDLIAMILRSSLGRWLVHIVMDKLSLAAVRNAWYDRQRVDDYVISGYTKPLRCREWEYALLEYALASSAESGGNVSKRLGEIKCPVLIVTGDSDLIVPAWNAHRLAKVFPKAECHEIKNCGHLPHEEKPEEFIAIIENFVKGMQVTAMDDMYPNAAVMPA